MKISDNNFSRKSFSPSGSFSSKTFTSGNSFSDKDWDLTDSGWGGENITSDPFGFDNPDGQPFGIGEFGGIRHFLKRTSVDITHE